MIAVIFEAEAHEGREGDYFNLAASLGPKLHEIDGFISVERFRSTGMPGKILSLSFWRDEAALKAWRTRADHRGAQTRGRTDIFRGYRLRVATVLRDYDKDRREDAPVDSRDYHQ